MPRVIIILLFSLLLLPACTIVDMGGAVDEKGKQVATPQVKKRSEKWRKGAYDYAPTPAWRKGDTYYIQVPIAYVPAQDWYALHYFPYLLNNSFEWPQRLTDAEISQYPTEIYYAVLNAEQFKEACRHPKIELTPRMRNMEYEIVPAAEVDLTGAEKLTNCAPHGLRNAYFWTAYRPAAPRGTNGAGPWCLFSMQRIFPFPLQQRPSAG